MFATSKRGALFIQNTKKAEIIPCSAKQNTPDLDNASVGKGG